LLKPPPCFYGQQHDHLCVDTEIHLSVNRSRAVDAIMAQFQFAELWFDAATTRQTHTRSDVRVV
jgi:hypothetical protein